MPEMISDNILKLLKELNIKLPKEIDKIEKVRKSINKLSSQKRTINVDLVLRSGQVNRNCQCCGHTSISYVDHIKNENGAGYTTKTVDKPTYAITRWHEYNVIECQYCKDLYNNSFAALIEMVKNLREKIYSSKQG